MWTWNKSILEPLTNLRVCWWCGSKDLSREHKFKRTDLDLLYGKRNFNKNEMILLKFKPGPKPIPIQSSGSIFLKFDPKLCKNCNNSRSANFDKAQEKVMSYYLKNEESIKEAGYIDTKEVFAKDWKMELGNFYRYFVKHACSRLVDSEIRPSSNLINFLDEKENLRDLKFVFQLKHYKIGEPNDSIDHIYLGPMNMFAQRHLFIGQKLTCATGWYTYKQFSINYVFRKFILKPEENILEKSKIELDRILFKGWEGKGYTLTTDTFQKDYSEMIEDLEYYPFVTEERAIEHCNYLLEKHNAR